MKAIFKGIALVAAGMLAVSAPVWAQAQSFSGKVTSVSKDSNSFTVKADKSAPGVPDKMELYVKPGTDLKGLETFKSLSVGDEVKVDVKREQAWFAESLEGINIKQQQPGAEQEQGFFSRAMSRIQGAWYQFRYDIRTNPEIYENYAQDRISRMESRLETLREQYGAGLIEGENWLPAVEFAEDPANQEPARPANVQDINKHLRQGEQALEESKMTLEHLQSLEPYVPSEGQQQQPAREVQQQQQPMREMQQQQQQQQRELNPQWEQAKSELESSLGSLQDSVHQAGEQILKDKRMYEWNTQNEIDEMRYDIEELKKAAGRIDEQQHPEVRNQLNQRINELEAQLQEVEPKLEELTKADRGNWQEMKGGIDQSFNEFRSTYYEAVGQVGRAMP